MMFRSSHSSPISKVSHEDTTLFLVLKEGYKLLNDIIDDIEFIEHKERLLQNKEHFKKKYNY